MLPTKQKNVKNVKAAFWLPFLTKESAEKFKTEIRKTGIFYKSFREHPNMPAYVYPEINEQTPVIYCVAVSGHVCSHQMITSKETKAYRQDTDGCFKIIQRSLTDDAMRRIENGDDLNEILTDIASFELNISSDKAMITLKPTDEDIAEIPYADYTNMETQVGRKATIVYRGQRIVLWMGEEISFNPDPDHIMRIVRRNGSVEYI